VAAATAGTFGTVGRGAFSQPCRVTSATDDTPANADLEAEIIRRSIDAANERDLVPAPAGSIVVGDDGSDSGRRSLESALLIAERFECGVVVLQTWTVESSLGELSDHHGYIRSFGEVTQALRARLEALRRSAVARHPEVMVEFRVVLAPPAEALVGLSRDAFMLVLGSRGRGALGSLVLGSVSLQCLRRAHCAVLVVPHRLGDETG
jgi:nucleotide-binding universal stress UspA family protein